MHFIGKSPSSPKSPHPLPLLQEHAVSGVALWEKGRKIYFLALSHNGRGPPVRAG